tara:strand:- start:63 stop:350 length:288 start_codon:yes stop_codon:yes gene_type:complete
METIHEEEYVEESCICKCKKKREGCCRCDCEECDPDWTPGIDTADEDSESDYDSSDSMDDVYEECGLSRNEKKLLQDELRAIIEEAETKDTHEEQ